MTSSPDSTSRNTARARTCSPAAAATAATRPSGHDRPSNAARWTDRDGVHSSLQAASAYSKRGARAAAAPLKGITHEEGRGDHQAVQARRGEGEPLRDRGAGHHRERGEGLRPAEGTHRALPGRGVRGRLPPQSEARDHRARGAGRGCGGDDREGGQDRPHRRREDLRVADRRGRAHPHRRARRRRDLKRRAREEGLGMAIQTAKDVLKFAKDNKIEAADLKFLDLLGLWQHFTVPPSELTEEVFEEGLGFDGSSIRGWQPIHASDMLVVPDPTTAVMDPFTALPTLSLICNIVDPLTKEDYSRDPRNIARKAEAYLKSTGIGDTAYFGPEPEFFVFDEV